MIAAQCELAESMWARTVGLLGRKGVAPGEGMLIAHTGSVHMFFMRFAIDVVFLDRTDTIVKIVPNLRPWRVAFGRRARTALELPTGTAHSLGLKRGMTVVVGAAG